MSDDKPDTRVRREIASSTILIEDLVEAARRELAGITADGLHTTTATGLLLHQELPRILAELTAYRTGRVVFATDLSSMGGQS